jgi:hypothetical protein
LVGSLYEDLETGPTSWTYAYSTLTRNQCGPQYILFMLIE